MERVKDFQVLAGGTAGLVLHNPETFSLREMLRFDWVHLHVAHLVNESPVARLPAITASCHTHS